MTTDTPTPRLVVVYEDAPLPDDLRAYDLVIRVVYEQEAHADPHNARV